MCAGLLQADVYDVYRLLESFAVQRRKFFEKPPLGKGVIRGLPSPNRTHDNNHKELLQL